MKEKIVDQLLAYLVPEQAPSFPLPASYKEKRLLLRALVNLREPAFLPPEILALEDQFLQLERKEKTLTSGKDLPGKIVVWQGDITTLTCDAIVNAGNEYLLGCFIPNHTCIDNQIHTMAGMRLRLACDEIMKGKTLATGQVVLTSGYNLPCEYVIHTVGPIVNGKITDQNCEDLQKCYFNSLELARRQKIKTIAFPCISTGVFAYPNKEAAIVAYRTVKEYTEKYDCFDKVIFNVFKKEDKDIYDKLCQGQRLD